MKTLTFKSPSLTLEEFAGLLNLELQIFERYDNTLPKYYVHFYKMEIVKGSILCSPSGNGNTVKQAIEDYRKRISGKKVTFDGLMTNKSYINIPKLIRRRG